MPVTGAAPRLNERAYGILADEIRQKRIPPGTRLNESGIATRFDISRAPARQALQRLEQCGLIAKAAGRGYLVSGEPEAGPASDSAPVALQRLVSSPSWERIYDEVEAEIVSRIAYCSWRIVETQLARTYGVSRTVARDVIARLQQAGLVRKDDRSRWFAPALTPRHVGELYEMRWALEPVALKSAVDSVPAATLERMRRNLAAALDDAEAVDGDVLDRLEHEMHVELLGYCGNRTMMQTLHTQQSLLIAHRFLYRQTNNMFPVEPFLPEHLDIVERLIGGDVDGAADRLVYHLKVSRERALSRVDRIARSYTPDPLPFLERFDG